MRQVVVKRRGGSVTPSRRWAVARSAAVAAAVAGVLASSAGPASAATVDWDVVPGAVGPGTGTIDGGTGNWDTTTGNWTTDGGTNNVLWNNANNDVARFSGTSGTVTLTTGVTASGLIFNSTGYTVTGNTLTLTGTPTITVTNAADTATVSSVLAGTGGLTIAGPGTTIINGANTFTGNITLNGGTLETNMAGGAATSPLGGQIGTVYRQLTFNNNARLRTTATWNDNTPSATNVGIQFNFAGAGTLDVNSGTTLTIDDGAGAGTAATNSQLVGSGTLTKTGTGTLSLGNGTSNYDTFTGLIVVNAGTLNLGTLTTGANSLGTTANGTTIASGAVLNVNGNTTAEPLTISGTGLASAPAGVLIGNGGTVSGTVAMAADSTIGGGGNLTLSGVVSGGFNLTKVGVGALILTGTNTYTGTTTIAGGSIRAAGFGTGLPNATNLIINGGDFEPSANFTGTTGTGAGQLQIPGGTSGFSAGLAAGVSVNLNGGAPLVWGSATFNPSVFQLNQTTALGVVTLQNGIDLNGAPRTLNSNGTNALPGVISGAITSTGGATGITMTGGAGGANVVQLTNTGNTGINSVTLTGGELGISSMANIGGGATPINFNGGGLQVLGTTLTGFGTNPVTFGTGKNIQFDINAAAHTFTFDAATPLLVGGTGGQTLTKVGAGTLKLAAGAANVVTTLNMNGGTLDLNGGTLTLSNGGGTTLLGTANSTITGGTLILGTGGGTNFADNSVSSGVTLTINSKVSGVDATTGFEYCCSAGGTILLNNPLNDFQGNVFINNAAGTIATPSIGNQNATASGLGRGTTVNLNFLGTRLQYTGTGETTDRIINLSAANSGAILDQSGPSGLLKFTTALSATGTGAKTLTLQGSTAGTAEFAGVIGNGSGTTGITKAGTGTWTLSGANTYTGTTTLTAGFLGISDLGNLGATAAPLVFNGGNLRVVGTTVTNFGTRTTTFTNNANAGIDVATAGNTFTMPAISIGTGDFTKTGPGTLAMTGTNNVRVLRMAGGTLDLGTGILNLNNAGGDTLRATADSVITGGTIVISMAGTTGVNFGDNSVSNGVTLTINSKLTFASGATTGFEYCCDNPGGTIALTNPLNDFPGVIQINQAGTVAAPGIGNAGAVGPIGTGSQIVLNGVSGTQGARFLYTGPGETTNRTVVLNQTQNILDASGTTTSASRLKFSSNISVTNAAAKTFTLQGTGYGELAGVVPDNTLATSVTKAGTGTWALSGTNTYTGVTTVAAGTLNVAALTDYGVAGPLGARTSAQDVATNIGILLQGGTLQYTGATPQSTNRQIRLNNNANNAIDASGSVPTATLSFTKTGANTDLYENAGARALTLTGTNTGLNTFALTLTDQAATTGVTSLNKTGPGTWQLTGASTYTGPTSVSAGLLLANNSTGSATGTSAVSVTGTGTLGGSGIIAGAVSIATGAAGFGGPAISPGNSPGILTTGNLTLNAGSDAIFELLGTTVGTGYDQLNVVGTINLGGADLIIPSVGTLTLGQTYTIINNDGADAVTGTFASGATVSGPNGSVFGINYAGGDGNDVVLTTTAVPEPASAGVLAAAAIGLLARRRRRRQA